MAIGAFKAILGGSEAVMNWWMIARVETRKSPEAAFGKITYLDCDLHADGEVIARLGAVKESALEGAGMLDLIKPDRKSRAAAEGVLLEWMQSAIAAGSSSGSGIALDMVSGFGYSGTGARRVSQTGETEECG